MFTLYTDKSEDFKCKIDVEGSDLSKTKARLVIESSNFTLMFEGKIDNDGDCVIPIKKLKGVLSESDKGNMRLEVIADDTFFSPWEGEYVVKTNKKVTVEVFQKEEKPIIENKVGVKVIVPEPTKKPVVENKVPVKKVVKSEKDHSKEISNILSENGITVSNITDNKQKLNKLIKEYASENKLTKLPDGIFDDIINKLKF